MNWGAIAACFAGLVIVIESFILAAKILGG